ncbi:unannotated protein [freshwater metagenome]|uniref:Unannotated protein n=1 Tax=freshwater metagenome TaxID=449393 RepID=A0A6J5Z4E6_9ZZZZ
MTGVLVVLFIFALIFVPSGKAETIAAEGTYDAPAASRG